MHVHAIQEMPHTGWRGFKATRVHFVRGDGKFAELWIEIWTHELPDPGLGNSAHGSEATTRQIQLILDRSWLVSWMS